jgi:hypothetical protein
MRHDQIRYEGRLARAEAKDRASAARGFSAIGDRDAQGDQGGADSSPRGGPEARRACHGRRLVPRSRAGSAWAGQRCGQAPCSEALAIALKSWQRPTPVRMRRTVGWQAWQTFHVQRWGRPGRSS